MPETTPAAAPEPAVRHFQCRHIFADGHRCGSKCLRREPFCYYHHTTRTPKPKPDVYRDTLSTFDLPLPEDRSAIQAAIGLILQRIANGCLPSANLYPRSRTRTSTPSAPACSSTASRSPRSTSPNPPQPP